MENTSQNIVNDCESCGFYKGGQWGTGIKKNKTIKAYRVTDFGSEKLRNSDRFFHTMRDQDSMQDDEPSRTEEQGLWYKQSWSVRVQWRQALYQREYIQCTSWHDGDVTRAAATVSTRNDSEDLSRVPTRSVRHNTFAMDIMFHVYVSVDVW